MTRPAGRAPGHRLLPAGAPWLVALCLLLAACAGGSGQPAGRAPQLPPGEALMGEWYVAARVPWFGERGRVASRLFLAPDGADRVHLTRSWREGFSAPLESDTATLRRDGHGGRVWKTRVYGVLPTRVRVLEAAEDGSWMLLDAPGRDQAWILSRDQRVEGADYLELERRIRGHGVNTDRLRRVPQLPEQEGRLGFEPAAQRS